MYWLILENISKYVKREISKYVKRHLC